MEEKCYKMVLEAQVNSLYLLCFCVTNLPSRALYFSVCERCWFSLCLELTHKRDVLSLQMLQRCTKARNTTKSKTVLSFIYSFCADLPNGTQNLITMLCNVLSYITGYYNFYSVEAAQEGTNACVFLSSSISSSQLLHIAGKPVTYCLWFGIDFRNPK